MHKNKVKSAQSRLDVKPPRFFKQSKLVRESADIEVLGGGRPPNQVETINVVDITTPGVRRPSRLFWNRTSASTSGGGVVRGIPTVVVQKFSPHESAPFDGILAEPQPSMRDPITVSAYNALSYISQRPPSSSSTAAPTYSRPASAPFYRTANLRTAAAVPDVPALSSAVASVVTSSQYFEFATLLSQLSVSEMPLVLEKAFQDACLAKQQAQAFASIPLYGDVRFDPYATANQAATPEEPQPTVNAE